MTVSASVAPPIAVVGRACVLPGALSPAALWQHVVEGRDLLSSAPAGRWRVPPEAVRSASPHDVADRSWSDRGGYVRDFAPSMEGYALPAAELAGMDPLLRWALHAAREALHDAGAPADRRRVGAIFGNLSFPSAGLAAYAEAEWIAAAWGEAALERLGLSRPDPHNRFMSGLPALRLRRALGLGGEAFCLDAACASSLYAVQMACTHLAEGRADLMLAGAVNCCDDLFIHIGFCALSAMSRTGRSRPFHAAADGLVPAEGAAFVALKRLEDALRDGDTIHGVIRAVGLSNDARGRNLLAPAEEGQARALRAAYALAGVDPREVSLLECHATGTPVGDATEIHSSARVFAGHTGLPIGSLKSNLGHLITAAGAAGLIKVMEAMRAGTRPPTLHAAEAPHPVLEGTPFRLLDRPEPWEGRRLAGISAFGFGGNNAHLVVEDPRSAAEIARQARPRLRAAAPPPVAVVALAVRAGDAEQPDAFEAALFEASPVQPCAGGVTLDLKAARFPPNDLKQALAQQLVLLEVTERALAALPAPLPRERTGIFIGMGADAEVARYGARWRMAGHAATLGADEGWLARAREGIVPVLTAAGVVGTMPNIPANRMNNQFDLGGASCTFSAEQLSGLAALDVATSALQDGRLDAAVVGAVDMSCEPVHAAAARAALPPDQRRPGDAAVVLVLKRLDEAERAGDTILAVLERQAPDAAAPPPARTLRLGLGDGTGSQDFLTERLGHAHAASGLLQVAAAALSLHLRRTPGGDPWLESERLAEVRVQAMDGAAACWRLRGHACPPAEPAAPRRPAMPLRLDAHPPPVTLPPLPEDTAVSRFDEPSAPSFEAEPVHNLAPALASPQVMAPAPRLPSFLELSEDIPAAPAPAPAPAPQPAAPAAAPVAAVLPPLTSGMPAGMAGVFARYGEQVRRIGALHHDYLQQQADAHHRFLQVRQGMIVGLVHAARGRLSAPAISVPAIPTPVIAPPQPPPRAVEVRQPAPAAPAPTPVAPPVQKAPPKPVVAERAPEVEEKKIGKPATQGAPGRPAGHAVPAEAPRPVGPTLDRAGLEVHSSGEISRIYGPLFRQQDGYAVQVRMPEPPLLLADRMTGLRAEAGSMGRGTIWTETDVTWEKWWLHRGRMPAGIMIESGQADLMLISYLGIDFLNQGERAYRLLGCELTYHRALPAPGETLRYDIHVDGHARQGPVRLFFFHYDCRIDGQPAITVRQGQAGFFTEAELADSAGVLWSPEQQEIRADATVDAPELLTKKRSFSAEEVRAFAEGRVAECFGPEFFLAETHTLTPGIQAGRMLFLRDIPEFDPKGGPWGRGYLRVEVDISPDDWFFAGHFKNDPCMPGTLMFEGCLQAMAFYMAALGFTLRRDGWRFEPVKDVAYALRCRGQVVPTSRRLTYEIFVEEVVAGPHPRIFADLLCTVDGLKAFHARGMGLELVPDWPITALPRLQAEIAAQDAADTRPLARDARGFPFDYASLMACAWGRPSEAFGSMYAPFDDVRRVARLPGPPYHFMSRVSRIDGPLNRMETGLQIELLYDLPPAAEHWYFRENGAPVMPFCVLLEAALQPCGWLASAVGSALTVSEDLSFRNLDGTGTLHRDLRPGDGTLRTQVTITNISRSAGMIIEGFEVRCLVGDELIYDLKTVFGFFPLAALENQVGLATTSEQRAILTRESAFRVDLTARPERYCGGEEEGARLAAPMLLMLDRVTGYWPDAGEAGLGMLRAEKDVDPAEWFFKAHFYQDPVQPGSLGIEAMIQLLQFYMLERGMAEGIASPRFESLRTGQPMTWKYRGQVVPANKVISTTLEVTEVGSDDLGPYAVARASLWVDGKRIYEAHNLGMRIVSDPSGGGSGKVADDPGAPVVLDPSRPEGSWLGDHRPTFQRPALPMMSMVDLLAEAGAAASAGGVVTGLRNVQVKRWVDFAGPRTLRREVLPSGEVRLHASQPDGGGEVLVAVGTVEVGPAWPEAPAPWPALEGSEVALPYETGALFHGPAFQVLRRLVVGTSGSSAVLDAGGGGLPAGLLNPALLDGATHGIPHDDLRRWTDAVAEDQVAYPALITKMSVFGPTPREGEVRCEVRYVGQMNSPRYPVFEVQLVAGERVWAQIQLVEACFPRGPLGSAPPAARRDFLRDRRYVRGVRLSDDLGGETRLEERVVAETDWLPGTVEGIYGTTDPTQIAVKEHLAARTGIHPGLLPEALPLSRLPVRVERHEGEVVVWDAGPEILDISSVRSWWTRWFDREPWPVEDLYYGLIERFVRRVVLADPEGFAAVRGRSVLYLANHQVGVESLLFSILASGLGEVPTVTLAKAEHRATWLGRLIAHSFAYPGVEDPQVIAFFDREDKASLPGIIAEFAGQMIHPGRSVMVHVEGTRSLSCRTPVEKMSGAFLDMALKVGAPVVPVRFVGGLPAAPLDKRIEFPVGMGRQDIWLGRPMLPEELARVPYGERKRQVIEAINALGPSNAEEVPLPGDPTFARAVEGWQASAGVSHEHATLLRVLQACPEPCAETRRLLDAVARPPFQPGEGPAAAWMAELADRLLGARAR